MNYSDSEFQISAESILAGLGTLDRQALCSLIAILETAGALSVAKEALRGPADKIGIDINSLAESAEESAAVLNDSDQSTSAIRHRLWRRINESLNIGGHAPLSSLTARENAAALALRTSERLSPGLRERRKHKSETATTGPAWKRAALQAVSAAAQGAAKIINKPKLIPFPELAQELILEFFADDNLMDKVSAQAEMDSRAAIEQTRLAAQAAIAGGLGWAAFAGIVANAGFAPYILAAQASAWIPLVSGPLLVSFLAFVINPITLVAGIGALAWLGFGRQANLVRSQMAAQFCALLSFQGAARQETGLSDFLTDMRRCVDELPEKISHTDEHDLEWRRGIKKQLPHRLLDATGTPPAPWNAPVNWQRRTQERDIIAEVIETGAVATVTAGEILWHAAAIDRTVLAAADFSRTEDLGDPLTFAAHAWQFSGPGSEAALRGYTAEQIVHDHLVSYGHHVQLPEKSNMPGYDLLVDGMPVQVKCGESLTLLREHFQKFPDIPVIANSELVAGAQKLDAPWSHLVSGLPGLDLPTVSGRVEAALAHAEEITDP